jgi:hypothetical protein
VVAISGVVHGPGRVEVHSVARVRAAGAPPGAATPLVARLVGADGQTLARGTVRRLNAMGCGCGSGGDVDEAPEPYAFEVYVPDVDLGAALVIEGDDGTTMWEVRAPSSPPRAGKLEAEMRDDGHMAMRWGERRRRDDPGRYEAWVQWSSDEGATWRALATGLTDWETTVDASGLPAGPVLVRVLVHDGFSTAASDPVRMEMPPRPPQVAILHPEEGGILAAGGTMRAWGAVTSPDGEPLADVWCRWLLDGREVGQGTDEWLVAPGPGEHRLTLLVRAEDGTEAKDTVSFTCRPGPASVSGRRR